MRFLISDILKLHWKGRLSSYLPRCFLGIVAHLAWSVKLKEKQKKQIRSQYDFSKFAIGKFIRFNVAALTIVSALFFHLALFAPAYFFWLVFFYLVPLFYGTLAFPGRFSFKVGFFWGVVFFSFHLHPVASYIINECFGRFRFFFPLLLIFYTALHAGVWFWLARKTSRVMTAFVWLIWTWLFFIWSSRGLLWISGKNIGYPLILPLLPLAEYPKLLATLNFFGQDLLVLFLICFSFSIALFFFKKQKGYLFVAMFFLIPFFFRFLNPVEAKKVPAFFKNFGHIGPPELPSPTYTLDIAQKIYYKMRQLLKKHPDVRYIVMPELCCRFPLNEHQNVIDLWTTHALGDEISLLIGACRSENQKVYNSLYFIKEGRVQETHDKFFLMPFAEYVPSWYKNMPCAKKLFLKNSCSFVSSKEKNKFFKFKEGFCCKNNICAEAIFEKDFYFGSLSDNAFLLSIFNDTLFSKSFHHLLFLWVKLKGLEQNKFSIFVGNSAAHLLAPDGRIFPLLTAND